MAIATAACAPAPARPVATASPALSKSPTVLVTGAAAATSTPVSQIPSQPAAPAAASPTPVLTSPAVPEGTHVGQRAPEFALQTPDGDGMRLSQFRGKTVLVNFWATWCAPCREEMPALNDLYQKYRDRDFVVLAVNFGDEPDAVRAYVTNGAYTFPVVLDRNLEVAVAYQVLGLPASYFVDADGVVRDRVTGAMTVALMQAKAQRLIGTANQVPGQPGSVAKAAGAANEQAVAMIGDRTIRMGDLNHRVDVLLALDRLHSGVVLDPTRPADRAELEQRQSQALMTLIDETLLAETAGKSGIRVDPDAIDQEMARLTTQAGGSDALAAELATHVVMVEDVRALFEKGFLANAYVDQVILPNVQCDSPGDPVRVWLSAERLRRGVKILQQPDR